MYLTALQGDHKAQLKTDEQFANEAMSEIMRCQAKPPYDEGIVWDPAKVKELVAKIVS